MIHPTLRPLAWPIPNFCLGKRRVQLCVDYNSTSLHARIYFCMKKAEQLMRSMKEYSDSVTILLYVARQMYMCSKQSLSHTFG